MIDVLALADELERWGRPNSTPSEKTAMQAAAALREMHTRIAAADAMHQVYARGIPTHYCAADGETWPCATHRVLHPEEP